MMARIMSRKESGRLTSKLRRVATEQEQLLVGRVSSGDSGAQAAAISPAGALQPEGVLLLSQPEWRITGADAGLVALLNRPVETLVGHPLREIVFADGPGLERMLDAAVRSSGGERVSLGELPFRAAEGEARELQGSLTRLRTGDGDALCLLVRDDGERRRILDSLRDNEKRYRMLFESSPEAMWAFDLETLQFLAVNATAVERYGWSAEEFLGMTAEMIRPPAERPHFLARMSELRAEPASSDSTRSWVHQRKDGSRLWANIASQEIRFAGRRALLCTSRDVTQLVQAEARLQEKDQLYQAVFEAAADAFVIIDPAGVVVHQNASFTRMFGFEPDELRGTDLHAAIVPEEDLPAAVDSNQRIASGEVVDFSTLRMRRDRSPVEVEVRGSRIGIAGKPHILARYTDITERRRHEQQIETLAFLDPLTELPNRFRLGMLLEQHLHQARLRGKALAVLFMDIDRFKTVNDSLGHSAGDALLTQSAQRIGGALRSHDLYGRLGGDEFLVILPEVGGPADALAIARRILKSMKTPFPIGGRELYTSISIGVSLFPEDGEDAEQLIKNADAAMYRAKERGRDTVDLYSPAITEQNLANLALESRLHKALDEGEMRIFYQPLVAVQTGQIIGFEALVRWQHPEQGLLPPSQFIGLAESTGFTLELAPWIMGEACKQIHRWRRLVARPLTVSLNLSARQFQQPGLAAQVREALDAAGLGPGALTLEITESSAMHNLDLAVAALREIKQLGCKIAIDDFGTGYSSLSYLKKLPVDIVKIDQSFTRDITTDPDDAAITAAVIAMARTLNLKVVAEGVETPGQLDFLRSQDCDHAQGFLFSPAVPPSEAEEMLTKRDGKLGSG